MYPERRMEEDNSNISVTACQRVVYLERRCAAGIDHHGIGL